MLLMSSGSVGCGDETTDEDPSLEAVPADDCDSGLKWTSGARGSGLMHPGHNCMRCHADEPDAPNFAVAGTVYGDRSAEDDCAGVEGAEVVIEDDSGQVVTLTTNRAGNFFLPEDEADLQTPLRASVRFDGRERVMQEEIFNGNCVDCHSGPDAVRAPHRVLIPAPQ